MYEVIEIESPICEQSFVANKRRLEFSGAKNFRDLGGYQTANGKSVHWGLLYRSDHLQKLTDADLKRLDSLSLNRVIDFRAAHEKEMEPDRLPAAANFCIVEIPILDSSTEIWRDSRDALIQDNLQNIDPAKFMIQTNIELVTRFAPQMRRFFHELISADGRPVLFHCAAGKDRTGYAAAILLRVLGVPMDVVMDDYLLSNYYYLSAHWWNLLMLRLMKGKHFAATVKGFLEVRSEYLSAAFETIDRQFGLFDKYVQDGLGLSSGEIEFLKSMYLE